MFRFRLGLAVCFLAVTLRAAPPEFEPNSGQAEKQYLFLARAGGARAYIEDRGLKLATSSGAPVRLAWAEGTAGSGERRGEWKISEATGNTTHYCLPGNSSLCSEGVKSYRRLLRKDLYPGIDWELHGRGGQLEYDLVVHPGAKVGDARLRVEGATAEVAADGRLRAGALLHWRPVAYQVIQGKRVEVSAALRSGSDSEFEFVLGDYDRGQDLIIDPVVEGIVVAGGADEDDIRGFLNDSRGSCTYRYGTTRSADWHQMPAAGGRHVFVQIDRLGSGSTTIFWGGEGEESIGGVDSDLQNCRLYLVGWTTSRNAPLLSGRYDGVPAQPYAGGATDGFVLKSAWDGLTFAGYLGGPGADRLYDIRTTGQAGSEKKFVFAGETDDTLWPGATVSRVGNGGKADAIAGVLDDTRVTLVAIGGAGDDRLMRVRKDGDGSWVVAGETNSPDFPVKAGTSNSAQAAAGQDLWLGRLLPDLSEVSVLQLFGGSGDERFGGLGVLEKQGLYLAGTTTSSDLPSASGAYHGGDSDGFVAYFDPVTAAPRSATYIGGSARDEIATGDARNGDLFLGGTTDSNDLTLPGLAAGEGIHGGLDALFVLCDDLGTPMRGIRLGGTGDDRVLGLWPDVPGKIFLSGSSSSREWLDELDPFHLPSSGQDGYVAAVSYPSVRFGGFPADTPGRITLGRDLQAWLTVVTTSEAGMDGTLLVRSSDPSRLLVSPRRDLPGSEQILLEGTDQTYNYSYGSSFVVQALADSGEVEIVVEGRAAASTKVTYPRRRIPVSLVPTALFISPPKDVSVPVNGSADVYFFNAPLLPDGTSGPPGEIRAGVTSKPGLISSDPAGLQIVRDSIMQKGSGESYFGQAVALKTGTYTLTPTTTLFAAGPGQSKTVQVVSSPAGPRVFGDQPLLLVKDHLASLPFNGQAGDQLLFTSEDPSRLVLGSDNYSSSGNLSVQLTAGSPSGNLVVAALSGEGTVRVRVEGTFRGQPVSESLVVYLVPYKASFERMWASIPAGTQLYFQVKLLPQSDAANVVNPRIAYMTPRPAVFGSIQLRSSNPAVIQVLPFNYSVLNYSALAAAVGEATIDFGPTAPVEFAELRASIKVVAPSLDFGADVLRVPAGARLNLYPTMASRISDSAFRAVRLRLSANAPLTLNRFPESGTDLTVDFFGGYGVQLAADTAQVGQQATLYISAPGMPEFGLPIRVVEAVLLPSVGEMQVAPRNGVPETVNASFSIGAYDEGVVVRADSGRMTSTTTLKLRPRLNPPGVCEITQEGEQSSNGGLTVPFICTRTGATELSLEPVAGLTAAQPQFKIRIVSRPGTSVPVPITTRVMTGNGLQALLPLNNAGGPFSGTITSNDPARVRLSLDAKAPGSTTVTIPRNYYNNVYVQGFASQGIATLTAETTDGRKTDINVYLLPSTLAVRPHSTNYAADKLPILSLDHPLSSTDLTADVYPGLVDPDTGKLIWSSGLSIRGGTDPAFVRARSSDSAIIEPVAPDAIVSEGDNIARLNFRVKSSGDTMLAAVQPEGFVEVLESSLRVHVSARELSFSSTPILSADLQMPVSIVGISNGTPSSVIVTITSLDPEKLRISSNGATTGEASLAAPLGSPVYLQALSTAAPGGTVRVRLEAAGYAATEREVEFRPAELQLLYQESSLTLNPLVSRSLSLRYGPVDEFGRISSQFNGKIRPGVRLPVRISSSDNSIVGVSKPEITLDSYMDVLLLPVAPGRAQIHIEAPPQVTNRVANLDAVVGLFEFPFVSLGNPVRYLVSQFNVTNPRSQPTAITVSSDGAVPLRFGLAASGTNAPSASTLQVTLAGKESRQLYVEPSGPGSGASVHLEAPDFKPVSNSAYLPDPQARFDPAAPLNLSLANGTAQVAIILAEAGRSSTGLPLGTSFGPLKLQLTSSNPQVVLVSVPTVEFAAGDSRKSVALSLVGRGDAVVSLTMPPAFAGASPVRQDLVVSVR